jgi:hypothetical protein
MAAIVGESFLYLCAKQRNRSKTIRLFRFWHNHPRDRDFLPCQQM